VTLSSSANPSSLGQLVTFIAKLTPANATGSVQFLDGTASLGTATVASGAASFPVSTLTVGSHSITAVYSGDGNNAAATSTILTQTVGKAVTTVVLTSSVNPSTFGQTVVLTAKVTPSSATGSVQFLDGGVQLPSAQLVNGVATLTLNPTTTTVGVGLAIGVHSLTAVYSGDGNNASSTSNVVSQTVNKAAATLTLTSSVNPSALGQSVTFTARVTPSSATGSVQFLDGITVLASPTLSGGVAVLVTAGSVYGVAPVAELTAGLHIITAVYLGDANNGASLPAIVAQTVNPGN
jgi:hypothetical protein